MSRSRASTGGPARLIVRVKLGGNVVFGPGKADLLESIDRLGSISAAAREMRMSYRQAWMLLDTMNAMFRRPVFTTRQGGTCGGGATLTSVGRQILHCYRSMQEKARRSTSSEFETLIDLTTATHGVSQPRRQII